MFLTISNKNNISLKLSTLGARMVSLFTPNKSGEFEDIIQGFDREEDYKTKGKSQGAIIGRVANRIENAQITIQGETYNLPKNKGPHTLHSGDKELRLANFEINLREENKIIFSYDSPHLENGFPGNVKITVIYELTDDNEIIISLQGETDRSTVLNLTSHPYFQLNGSRETSIIPHHQLQIFGSHFLETDEMSIPTGKLIAVEGTAFDFRRPTPFQKAFPIAHPQKEMVGGYDHCYVLDNYKKDKLKTDAIVTASSGRTLTVLSTYPAIQLYTANGVDIYGKNNQYYGDHSAICLEPQYFPNAINEAAFDIDLVTPQNPYNETIIYKFGVI